MRDGTCITGAKPLTLRSRWTANKLCLRIVPILAATAGLSGCSALLSLFQSNSITVLLENTTTSGVDVKLYFDDQQDIPEFLLTEIGTKREFTILPGGSRIFVENCDDLQAIVIDDADLLLFGGAGPEANSDVLRDGDDFRCGDQIVFTFFGGLLDFDVSSSVTGF